MTTKAASLSFHLDGGIIHANDGTWCYPANGTEKDLFAALAVSAADNAALRADFQALQHALVGNTGASAILTAGALRKRVKELTETLRFVERWAVHHGTKAHMTAEEALSCIQHYPAIRAITRSYADGKEPETPNPWKRVEELEAASQWRPIETAPKDGTEILLTNGVVVAQGNWLYAAPSIRERRDVDGRYVDQDESDGYDGWIDFSGGMQPDPTHWMPLPSQPKEPK